MNTKQLKSAILGNYASEGEMDYKELKTWVQEKCPDTSGRMLSCLFKYDGLIWADEEKTRVKFTNGTMKDFNGEVTNA